MFFHLFKYKLKSLFKTKDISFWTIAFPLILGTLFFVALGPLIETTTEFEEIPVAIVTNNSNPIFESVLENTDDLFIQTKTDKENALSLMEEGKVSGIIYVDATPYVSFKENGINQTVIKSFVEEYLKQFSLGRPIETIDYFYEDIKFSEDINFVSEFFFALVAMTCLYASFTGVQVSLDMKANISPLGMRREIGTCKPLLNILSDFSAAFVLQAITSIIFIIYIQFILKIHLANNIPALFIIMLIGNTIGIALGLFVGSLNKSEGTKIGIVLAFSMVSSFLAGLMINGIRNEIEHSAPIINRINPSALICDAIYSLNMYGIDKRFYINMGTLLAFAVVLCALSYIKLRRNKYASV